MEKKTVYVPNIVCGHCVKAIERDLGELAGIHTVTADAEKKTVAIEWSKPLEWDTIAALLVDSGYPSENNE